MKCKPGTKVPTSGIYWCSVCKTPDHFAAGQDFPNCRNMCGRGYWEFVEEDMEPDSGGTQ